MAVVGFEPQPVWMVVCLYYSMQKVDLGWKSKLTRPSQANMAWVVQWLAHQTGNLEVVGSNPTPRQIFALTLKLLKYYILGYVASVWWGNLPLIYLPFCFPRKFSCKAIVVKNCINGSDGIWTITSVKGCMLVLFNAKSWLGGGSQNPLDPPRLDGLGGAVGSAPDRTSGGRGFESHPRSNICIEFKTTLILYIYVKRVFPIVTIARSCSAKERSIFSLSLIVRIL